MTRELENLVRLYAAIHEVPDGEKNLAASRFAAMCSEIAVRSGSNQKALERFAVSVFRKMQASADRRFGRPHAPH